MKKMLVCGLGAAMMVSSASGVFAEEATPITVADAFVMNYGVSVISPDSKVNEDIQIVTNGESASGSLQMTVEDGEETIELALPEYVLATKDTTYINGKSIMNLLGVLTGSDEIGEVAEVLGITEDWVKMAPIDLNAIQVDVKPFDVQIPEFSEEMMLDLQKLAGGLVKMQFTDDNFAFVVNNETLQASAAEFDAFKDKYLGFVGDILVYAQDVLAETTAIDVKPAIRDYLDAIAAGYVEANEGVSEEDAKAMIDGMVDGVITLGLAQAAEQIKEVPVADIWNSMKLSDIVAEIDDVEAIITMGEEGFNFDITVGEASVSGNIEMKDNETIITFLEEEEKLGSINITTDEDSFKVAVKDEKDVDMMDLEAQIEYNEENVNASCSLEVPSEEVVINGYFNMEKWEDDGSLAEPETYVDGLAVVKNVSALLFTPYEDTIEAEDTAESEDMTDTADAADSENE